MRESDRERERRRNRVVNGPSLERRQREITDTNKTNIHARQNTGAIETQYMLL
jgi:hypothetical protein